MPFDWLFRVRKTQYDSFTNSTVVGAIFLRLFIGPWVRNWLENVTIFQNGKSSCALGQKFWGGANILVCVISRKVNLSFEGFSFFFWPKWLCCQKSRRGPSNCYPYLSTYIFKWRKFYYISNLSTYLINLKLFYYYISTLCILL